MEGLGKRKRESMEEIQNQQSLYVAFSKRRQGLFKKAEEFSSISGSRVAVVVVSKAGVVYTHGSPQIFHDFISATAASDSDSLIHSSSAAATDRHLIYNDHRSKESEIGCTITEAAPT